MPPDQNPGPNEARPDRLPDLCRRLCHQPPATALLSIDIGRHLQHLIHCLCQSEGLQDADPSGRWLLPDTILHLAFFCGEALSGIFQGDNYGRTFSRFFKDDHPRSFKRITSRSVLRRIHSQNTPAGRREQSKSGSRATYPAGGSPNLAPLPGTMPSFYASGQSDRHKQRRSKIEVHDGLQSVVERDERDRQDS